MTLCDRLESAQKDRETARVQFRDGALTAPVARPDATGAPVARIAPSARQWSAIASRTAELTRIRQAVIDLAIQGQLTFQGASSRPVKGTASPIDTPGGDRSKGSEAAAQPLGWSLARLSEVRGSITDGDHLPPPRSVDGVPCLVIGNVRTGKLVFGGERFVSRAYYSSLQSSRRPMRGDLLYTLVGSFGIPVIVRDDCEFCVQRHIGILRPRPSLQVEYFAIAMAASSSLNQAASIATGIAQKTVPLAGLRRMQIPVPPLDEQYRVVAKVNQLMALCDQLEAHLKAGDLARSRLLDALIAETLDEAKTQPA